MLLKVFPQMHKKKTKQKTKNSKKKIFKHQGSFSWVGMGQKYKRKVY
jgi:hypothetical protein